MSYVTRLERERDRKNVLACKTDRKCLSERERERRRRMFLRVKQRVSVICALVCMGVCV